MGGCYRFNEQITSTVESRFGIANKLADGYSLVAMGNSWLPIMRLLKAMRLSSHLSVNMIEPLIPLLLSATFVHPSFIQIQGLYVVNTLSHLAHEDAMGESALFIKLYGLLMALKSRDINQFLNAIGNMDNAINSPAWICDAIQNLYLHQLMRFTSNRRANVLFANIVNFLTSNVKCGGGTGEVCLKLRRN